MDKTSKIPALAEVCEEQLLGCENILPKGFEFSEDFERRMSGIIGARPKPRLRSRLKAALVIAVIFAAGFCLGMGKEPIWNYIVSRNADGSKNVTFDPDSIKDPKKCIEELYELSAIPKDFELMYSYVRNESAMQDWSKGMEGGRAFFFYQFIPEAYTDATFTGTATYYFDDDGTQYYIDSGETYTAVVWEKDGYVFLISGGLNKDETLNLCKSLKKTKNRSEFSQIGQ